MILHFIKKIRMIESLMMIPFFFMGYIFAQPKILTITLPHVLLLIFHFYLLIQSIYLLNSYLGKKHDRVNKRFQGITITNKNTELLFVLLSIITLAVSLAINYINNWNGSTLILINYFLWILYASSYVNFKSNFLMGSLVHFLSGIINFLIGYTTEGAISYIGVAISIYFSLLFVAGHMHHMVIDYEADKSAELKTLPSIIGIKKTSLLSITFILIALSYFVGLSFFKVVPVIYTIPVILACLVHLVLYIIVKDNLNFDDRIRYRTNYRIIHAFSLTCLILIYLMT